MNSRRTIILIVAVVVGAIASFGLLNYVRGLETEAQKDAELAEVWVVNQPIARGTPGETAITGDFIVKQQVPVQFIPSTAITDPAVELANLVAVTDLAPNSTLVAGNFVTPGVITTGITDRLEEKGMVTFTMSLDQVRGAAYMIQPGDFINILKVGGAKDGEEATDGAVDPADPAQAAAATEDTGPYEAEVRYVYQMAEVLAIDKTLPADLGEADPEAGAAAGNLGMITLAVPPEAVQLLLSVDPSTFYLSLVPSTYVPKALPLPTYGDLLPGEEEGKLTPYWETQQADADAADGGNE
ncbi:MAG: RcpC/CpaB family pilus assembly protein [Acidimicrobiales bacterium]